MQNERDLGWVNLGGRSGPEGLGSSTWVPRRGTRQMSTPPELEAGTWRGITASKTQGRVVLGSVVRNQRFTRGTSGDKVEASSPDHGDPGEGKLSCKLKHGALKAAWSQGDPRSLAVFHGRSQWKEYVV
jgi:hypothetical protein